MEAGKVYSAGAGPGAEDLLTLHDVAPPGEADVMVYARSLVNAAFLEHCRPEAETHDSTRLDLNEVLDTLIPTAKAGERVMRLHTGDPPAYGTHREQMDVPKAAAVSFEVRLGVSSFFGAAASLRTEYTLPGVSQTVTLTRVVGRAPVPREEGPSVLTMHGASLAFFFSAGRAVETVKGLFRGGYYTTETSAAIIYKAIWPNERVLRTTPGELVKDAEAAGITKTALFLIEDFLSVKYEDSKLCDPGSATESREGKQA